MIFKGIEIDVEYEYFAGDAGDNHQPMEQAHIEIEKVTCGNADLTPLFEHLDLFDELEEEILTR